MNKNRALNQRGAGRPSEDHSSEDHLPAEQKTAISSALSSPNGELVGLTLRESGRPLPSWSGLRSTCSSARQADHQKMQITGDKIRRSPEEERIRIPCFFAGSPLVHIESHGEIEAKKSMIVI